MTIRSASSLSRNVIRQNCYYELYFEWWVPQSSLRHISTTMGTSTSRNSNSAGSANPSASAAPGLRVPATRPSDRRDKAIAASDDRRDVSVAGLVICQGTTQRGNTDLEIALSDEGLGPDLRDQLRLADDLARAFDKSDQEIEGATADRDGLATFQQKSSCPEQPERTKGYFELGRVILAINCLDRRFCVGGRRRCVQTAWGFGTCGRHFRDPSACDARAR